jgi:glycosyltransferase involved in cell wall biosynthesis
LGEKQNVGNMEIVIGHYHLHPGGVTKIIDSQIKSLRQNYPELPVKIVCGHAENEQLYQEENVPVIINSQLNYLAENYNSDELGKILEELKSFFVSQLSEESILHFHNPNLGKNPLVAYCLYELAKDGYRVFNHAHDFAEDRPQNMEFIREVLENGLGADIKEIMYPEQFTNYRFGVINSFDKERLIESQIPEDRITHLPNPVGIPEETEKLDRETCRKEIKEIFGIDSEKKIVTYPVRVIRRKNIGELILLSELFRHEAVFLVTLAPKNPVEIEPYKEWKSFCAENQFDNILFEVAGSIDFNVLMKGSDFCITTSIREGFGMAFMEPWLYHTPVIGRNIDYIVKDFFEVGLSFPNNYDKLIVPDKDSDFKNLSEKEQKCVINKIISDSEAKEAFFSYNKHLKHLLAEINSKTIENNRKLIVDNYSFKNYGKKLLETYQGFSGSG